MQRSKSAILVSDIFPPVADVGVYRTVALCNRLVERGWAVTVVTARPRPEAFVDRALLAQVPEPVRILRAASPNLPVIAACLIKGKAATRPKTAAVVAAAGLPGKPTGRPGWLRKTVDWLSWWMHVPDTLTGWLLPAVWTGLQAAKRARPDIVYSTAPAWTSHLVGLALSRLVRVRLVADFQDPWCGSAWHQMPYSAHRWLNEHLERAVVRRASQITCAWDGIRRHLVNRYPSRADDIQTILNGFDPAEIDGVEPARADEVRCVLLHAGTFYGPRSPIPLFEGLGRLQSRHPDVARRSLVLLIGRPDYRGRSLEALAHEYGVGPLVRVMPLMPRLEALAMLKGADVALLFGQSGNESLASVPAKTYDYVAVGKPVLAIGAGDEVCDIVRRGGCRLWRVSSTDPEEVAQALLEVIGRCQNGSGQPQANLEARLSFAWPASAARLESVVAAVAEANARTTRPRMG